MTSINCLRFDDHSGMCLCDEARTWNAEEGRLLTADKMRPFTSEEVMRETGCVFVMGKTGTSTLGNEYLETAKDELTAEYRRRRQLCGAPLERFMTVREAAHFLFASMSRVKRVHTDYLLKARFGFSQSDFIAGFYHNEAGERIDITEKTIVDKVAKLLTWEDQDPDATPVFGNAQIIAGCDPEEGFGLYRSSLYAPHVEPVHELYSCDGSGVDSADFVYTVFNNARSVPERRGAIGRVEGATVMLEAMNMTTVHSGGCDGYYKMIFIDGHESKPAKRCRQIHDARSKLASEIVRCGSHGFVAWKNVYELIDSLLFQDGTVVDVNDRLMKHSRSAVAMMDMLRGRQAWRDEMVGEGV